MKEKLKRRIDISLGKIKPQLVLKNAKIVNVLSHTITQGDIAIDDGTILGIGDYNGINEFDVQGVFVAPGLIDSHVHIESAMVTPSRFARTIVPKGTTTIIADPHEIANVCGLKGIYFMLKESEKLPLDIFFMLPSCVPATDFESSGAVLKADDLAELINHKRVLGLGELMNYPGLLAGDDKVLDKIIMAGNKIIDGHSPNVRGKDLNAYIASGIKTDHECTTLEEMNNRIELGMYVLIREGTASHDLQTLIAGVTAENSRRCLFCTDDKHPEDILSTGHINYNLYLAVKHGLDPITAVQMATINAAECYGLKNLGAVAPGYAADLVVFEDLKNFKVRNVFKNGIMIAEDDKPLFEVDMPETFGVTCTVNIKPVDINDFQIKVSSDRVNVIKIVPHSLITKKVVRKIDIKGGVFKYNKNSDIIKMAVIERHKATGNIGLGLLEGFGLKCGAIASTVAHDSHNIVVIGDNDEDMLLAVKEVERVGGGITICSNGNILQTLALPIAGLISDDSMEEVNNKLKEMINISHEKLKVNKDIDPFMTLSFLALPVIPEIKLTDKGLFDVNKFSFISINK